MKGPKIILAEDVSKVVLTTESVFNHEIIERLEIITAECVFGMNIFKDIFAGVRDIVGGRSSATQTVLRDARIAVLSELKKEAHSIGANAVIAVDIDYSEMSGGGKSMLFVVASGTAVKAKI
ncbi:YbjQ family protein [Pseudomonadales bacterium]|nr:YbjQ family protein [Pseudomonadales bacterium]